MDMRWTVERTGAGGFPIVAADSGKWADCCKSLCHRNFGRYLHFALLGWASKKKILSWGLLFYPLIILTLGKQPLRHVILSNTLDNKKW